MKTSRGWSNRMNLVSDVRPVSKHVNVAAMIDDVKLSLKVQVVKKDKGTSDDPRTAKPYLISRIP